LGNAYLEIEKYQEAIENFNDAIRINPKDSAAYEKRGTAYKALADLHVPAREEYLQKANEYKAKAQADYDMVKKLENEQNS
jgi:tetratricopeptide (TPR) repeat protein